MERKNQDHWEVVGMMSGTSLDGLDLVHCKLKERPDRWRAEIIKAETIPYDAYWKEQLGNAHQLEASALIELDIAYGNFLASKLTEFLQSGRNAIDLIASHGHTVFHQPASGITRQIGDGSVLHELTGIPVVYDFRSLDVFLGGQGAPLVPLGDQLLYPEYDACLNLGGFGNVSFEHEGIRMAFDVCPVNMVLNHLAMRKGMPYDEGGVYARAGEVRPDLLCALDQLEYYQLPYPKSLGREWYEAEFYPIIKGQKESDQDLLRTSLEHIANQLSSSLNTVAQGNILVTGGGTYNVFLLEQLQAKTKANLFVPDDIIIDFKEALIFALLGVLRAENRINTYASVTGANMDSSGGRIVC